MGNFWARILSKLKKQKPEEPFLFCDNQNCGGPIINKTVAYDATYQEIFHPGECAMESHVLKAHLTLGPQKAFLGKVAYIPIEKAYELFKKSVLAQSRKQNTSES